MDSTLPDRTLPLDEWLRDFDQLPPAERATAARIMLVAAGAGHRCAADQHETRLASVAVLVARLRGLVDELVDELADELDRP